MSKSNLRPAGWCLAGCLALLLPLLPGCLMNHSTSETIIWNCSRDGLSPELVTALREVARKNCEAGNQPLVINSGRRTLRHQARLMAGFGLKQLEGMYCRNGYPSYIRAIADFRRREKRAPDAEEVYAILSTRTEGYISSHLYGGAVDIDPRGQNVETLETLLKSCGFRTIDERSLGIVCLHATHLATPKRIICK